MVCMFVSINCLIPVGYITLRWSRLAVINNLGDLALFKCIVQHLIDWILLAVNANDSIQICTSF